MSSEIEGSKRTEVNEDGKKDGKGIFYYKSGDKYEGEYKNGKREGKGITFYKSGGKYDGEWKNGNKEGKGVYLSKEGEKYDGEYKKGKQDGKGTFTLKNGVKFVGTSKEWFKYETKTIGPMVGSVFDAKGFEYPGKWNCWKNNSVPYFVEIEQRLLLNRNTGEMFATELKGRFMRKKGWKEGKSMTLQRTKGEEEKNLGLKLAVNPAKKQKNTSTKLSKSKKDASSSDSKKQESKKDTTSEKQESKKETTTVHKNESEKSNRDDGESKKK